MEPTLEKALDALFGAPQKPPPATRPAGAPALQPVLTQTILAQARAQLEQAQQALQGGDWARFGAAMEALKHQLEGAPGQ